MAWNLKRMFASPPPDGAQRFRPAMTGSPQSLSQANRSLPQPNRAKEQRRATPTRGAGARLTSFLARTYNLKVAADYAVGADAGVSAEEATEAIEGATQFVEAVEQALSSTQ